MFQVRKAIITAAGRNHRSLALQTLVDRDGQSKSALRIILDEAVEAGVLDIGLVIQPGDQDTYRAAAGDIAARLHFIEQTTPRGYAHALLCARDMAAGEPFLHMVSDHLYVSGQSRRCAQQLVGTASARACAMSAVAETHESRVHYYGTIGGRLLPGRERIYKVEKVVEKPSLTEAEQQLLVPGLRAGRYFCYFGMHVLTPPIFELIEHSLRQSESRNDVPLSSALARLADTEDYQAMELQGRRFNLAANYGLWRAQLALALEGRDRDEVLTQLVELLALRTT